MPMKRPLPEIGSYWTAKDQSWDRRAVTIVALDNGMDRVGYALTNKDALKSFGRFTPLTAWMKRSSFFAAFVESAS